MALTMPAYPEQDTIPATMRAAVLFGPRDIRVLWHLGPRPGPGQVPVKVAMCGTCGSDLKVYHGQFRPTVAYGAFTPGHEWAGTVVALGETVDEFAVGDQVCIEAYHGCCRCDNCLIGKYTACLNYGIATKGHHASGITANGGFAQYVLHHVSAPYKLPPQVSFKDAVLLTTAGTGLYGLNAAGGYIAGNDIAIFGPGPMGLMTVQACKQMGAAQGRLRGAELVTYGFPLEDIAEAFRVLHERIDDPIKIVLIP